MHATFVHMIGAGAALTRVPLNFKKESDKCDRQQHPFHPMPTRLRSLRNISLFFNQNIMCEVSGRTRVDWNPQLKKFRLVYLWSAAPQTSGCRETPGGCENADSGMVGLAWGPRFCILYKFQGDDSDMLVCRPHFGLQRCIF